MPFIFGEAESAGFVFLSYLFVLSVGNLYLSSRIKWPTLAQVSFILSLSVIEYIGISDAVSPLAAIGLLSGFFYVYTYYWSFDGFQLKEKLSKQDLTILVANIFYFIYVMLNISADSYLIAGALITHAILLSVTVKTLHLMKSIVAPVYMLMIGLLIATAVFVLSPADVTSIVWAIEGLAMLYIGFKFSHKLIRAEGYAIYIIAMSGLLWQAIEAFSSISSATLPWHWINLVAFGALSFVAYQLIYRYKDIASSFEIKAAAIQNEIFTFWGATALCIILVVYFLDAIAVLAVIPMIWCFYRVSRHQLKFAQLTGYLFFIAFIVQIAMGMVDIQSTVITEQSIYSWIAMLEVLIFTWAMRKYYQHYELEGLGRDIANAIHTAFFYAPAALILLGLYNIYTNHIVGSAELELSYLWLDFTLVGALLFIVYKLIPASVDSNKSDIDTHYAYILSESISLFISVFFLYTVSIVFGEWMYNAAVIPMFYLLYRGLKSNLKLTEKLAWLHFSLFGAMTYLSYQTVGNFHFSEQSIPTMIGWVEILLSAWAMQSIYDHLEFKKGGYEYSRVVRIGVYLLIPLLFLPRIMRLYADYLPVALWLSFVISWLMYKKLKIEALLKELSILFVVAIFSTVFMSSAAIVGFNELFGLVALITGVLVVSVFHYVEKTLSCRRVEDSPYHYLILISPYFYGFVLTGLSYAATHQISISLVITGLYFLYLTQERKLFNVMKQTLNISYALSWIALISVPVLVFIQLIPENPYLADILVVILVNLIALAGLWYLTHHKVSSLEFLKRKYSNQNIQHWLCHILAFVVYTGSLNLLFMPWSMGISIAMLIHAVLILFLTLSVRYKELIKLSIILYSLTAIKLLFHDMGDSGNLFKVIALMCIGSILMVAAFFFQKLKNKQLA